MTLEGISKVTGAQEIYLRDLSGAKGTVDQSLRLKFPLIRHPRSPWISEPKDTILEVYDDYEEKKNR